MFSTVKLEQEQMNSCLLKNINVKWNANRLVQILNTSSWRHSLKLYNVCKRMISQIKK